MRLLSLEERDGHLHSHVCPHHEDSSHPTGQPFGICVLPAQGLGRIQKSIMHIAYPENDPYPTGRQCPYLRDLHRPGDRHRRVPDQRHHRGPDCRVCGTGFYDKLFTFSPSIC